MAHDECTDAFPQQHQRQVLALILGPYKAAAKLEGMVHLIQESTAIPEESVGVQPRRSVLWKDLVAEWREKGPIVRFRDWVTASHQVHQDDLRAIEARVDAEIEAAVAFAEASPLEPVVELTRHVLADEVVS